MAGSKQGSSDGGARGLVDALRRYVDAVTGFSGVSRERAERIVGDLARRGEVRAGDLRRAARQLADRSARNRRELTGLVRKEIRRQMDGLGVATREDVDRLQRRVRDIERGKTAKRAPAAARKPKAKPAPAARRAAAKPAARRKPRGATRKGS